MWGILLRIGGAALPYVLKYLLPKLFPSLAPKPSVEEQLQAETDRANILQSELDAKTKSEAARDDVRNGIASQPERLREHDPFERPAN